MEHSIALVTGTTSGLGYAAASMLATKGYRQVIVTGRSLARVQETAAQLAAETNTQVFTPLELELNTPASVQSALAELVKRGRPIDFLLLNAGMVGGKKRRTSSSKPSACSSAYSNHVRKSKGSPRLRPCVDYSGSLRYGARHIKGRLPDPGTESICRFIHRRDSARCQR